MRNLKYEFRRLNIIGVTSVAVSLVFINFIVWCSVGSPIYTLHFVSSRVPALPLWLYGLFDFLSFALFGISLGAVLSEKCQSFEVYKYRGGFYFIIGITLAYLYHAFFFSCHLFFISFLTVILQCFLFGIAAVNFFNVSKISVLSLCLGALWSFYLLFFSVFCFLFM